MTKEKFIEWVQNYAPQPLLVEAALTGVFDSVIGHIGLTEDFDEYCAEHGHDDLKVAFDASVLLEGLEPQKTDLGYVYSLDDYEVAHLVRDLVVYCADAVERAIHSVTSNAPCINGADDDEEFWLD